MSRAFEAPENDELVDEFFDFTKVSAPRSFLAPQKKIEVKIKVEQVEVIDGKREEKGIGYAKQPRLKEEQNLAAQSLNMPSTSAAINLFEDNDETLGIEDGREDPELPELTVFQRYLFNINPQKLPILEDRDNIIKKIHDNRVLVLSAMTGTGKSSQIPQYILEEAQKNMENCNIIITQPRRIAAITLAKRVALERKCVVGSLVGYQVGLDKQMDEQQNSDTRILFCTTGILVRKLIAEKSMKRWTHVILDEVHERDIEMEFLLIIVRRLLASKNPYVKIILMSATLNAEKISKYFTTFNQRGAVGPAPMIKLQVNRPFKIDFTYLDPLEHLGASRCIIDPEKPGISKEMYEVGAKTMELVAQKKKGSTPPSFLVFLPGLQEIQRFKRELEKPRRGINISEYSISVLHSSFQDQTLYNKVFDSTISRKIILATNIAESSLTLPGVTFVIDFCLTKYQQTDTATNISHLKLDWASLTSLEQRAGRVGRLEQGQVVRLIYKDHYKQLPKETIPEMQRAALESVVLKAKQLNMGKPSDILALALDPPNRSNITDAILVLKEIGGLTRYKNGIFSASDGELTFAGDVMALLPVDVRISKLIILGFVFSCVKECIIIGAGLSSKPIFAKVSSIEGKMNEYQQKLLKARGTGSDAIMILNVYQEWRKTIADCEIKGIVRSFEKKWCDIEMLDLKNLRDLHELIEDIKQRMERRFGISADDDVFRFSTEQKLFAIKICIAGAFYPNYFTFGGSPPWREQFKDMNNMDLCKTVYLKGMRPERIGKIYERQVREKLKDLVCDNLDWMKVKFDRNSARLQVKFDSITGDDDDVPKVPGEVRLEVYKALKLAKLQRGFELRVMSDVDDEVAFAIENQLGDYKNCRFELTMKKLEGSKKYIYPKMDAATTRIEGRVTHIVNCGKFFFQPEKGRRNILAITEILDMGCRAMRTLEDVKGDCVIIKHEQQFKRGRIIEHPDEDEIEANFVCLLIDYGMVIKVPFGSFYACAGFDDQLLKSVFELPPQCYECRLSEVIPSAINCPSGWSESSTKQFKRFIDEKIVTIEINAFVERVASVQLYAGQENMNENLVLNQFAQRSDDSYIQMYDQLQRNGTEFYNSKEAEEKEVEFPPHEDFLNDTIKLDGPISSLERRVESLCRRQSSGQSSSVTIDQNSVNHIVVDPFPYDGVKKLMVAASLSKQSGNVTLSKTTLMGHLPGMASLLVLIFSPVAELRCNAKETRYSTILSGLGCDENRKPHYSEHDQLIFVDVELDSDDFKLIEDLRSTISLLMQADTDFKWKLKKEKKNLRNKACTLLKKIVKKERSPLGINMESCNWNWQTSTAEHQQTSEAMLPPHPPITELSQLSEMGRRDLRNHAEELARKAKIDSRDEIILCQLCNETIETLVDLQLHVMKNLHKEQLMKLRDEAQNVL